VLAIACYDLGEFVRFHPRGRKVLSKMDGKVDIMKLMTNPDPEVQKHALLCVQKMMVHNWEYLSKAN
jgi:V-type H+-transporting ATPase subunit H